MNPTRSVHRQRSRVAGGYLQSTQIARVLGQNLGVNRHAFGHGLLLGHLHIRLGLRQLQVQALHTHNHVNTHQKQKKGSSTKEREERYSRVEAFVEGSEFERFRHRL